MLVGGDLGFWFRVVMGAFAVLLPPFLGLVARHKWRRRVARSEEIERLCAMASEEAELAKLEPTARYSYGYGYGYGYSYDERYGGRNDNGYGYGGGAALNVEFQMPAVVSGSTEVETGEEMPESGRSSQKMLYPCALCSCLTNQKCSRCKAVYYCSGKCQIFHWRQGHKDECLPYNPSKKNNMGVASHIKSTKLEEDGNHGNCVETKEDSMGKPVETFNVEPASSGCGLSAVHGGKDDSQLEHPADDSRDYPNSKSASYSFGDSSAFDGSNVPQFYSNDSIRSGGLLCNDINEEKFHFGPANTGQPEPYAPKNPISFSSVSDEGTHFTSSHIKLGDDRSSAPSALTGVSASMSSICEPSMTSSGFWEGKIVSSRCRADAPDDSSHCSSEADECSVLGSEDTLCSAANIVTTEESKGNLGSTKPPKLAPERSSHVKASAFSTRPISKPTKHDLSECSTTIPVIEGPNKASNLPSLISETLNFQRGCRINSSNKLEFGLPESGRSVETVAPLNSDKGRCAVESSKAATGLNVHAEAACSLELSGHQLDAGHALRTSAREVVDILKTSAPTRQNAIGASTETMAKYKGLFPYELFVKLYNWNKVEFHPSGLVNCGNSCYANAVLQCLAFTPPLTSYFLQELHSKTCRNKNWCFTCEFESLILKAKDGTSPLSPIQIISHLQNIGSHLGHGKEEDAHEFLRYAIDAMQFICLQEAGIKESGSLEEGTTLVGLTFGGYLRSKIECMRCGFRSERQERMMDLTVEIDGDVRTLEEALKQFTRVETLDGDNKYLCGRCNSYQKARKKLKVQEAPNILTIALKRYQSGRFGKLNKPIRFPEILNFAPYMFGTSDKSPIYRLYGVIVHLDTMNTAFSGHYVCYVKNFKNKWFKADDSTVKMVNLDKVLTKGAYMLFYARCSPRAPRSVRSSVFPRDPRNTRHDICKSRTPSAGSWGVSTSEDSTNGEVCHECISSIDSSFRPRGTVLEDDSSSDNSSFFSEVGSYSTDSSNRDSTCTDEHFDYGEMGGVCWNFAWRSSSDSDTSSSSSSPSPLFSRQSPLACADRYASETKGPCIGNAKQGLKRHGYCASASCSNLVEASYGKEDSHFSYPGSSKLQFIRKSVSSSSIRETETSGLGHINPFNKAKSGLSTTRKLTSERTGK